MNYIEETEYLINEIKKEDNKVNKEKVKDLIIRLADHISNGIDENRPEVIARFKTILATDTEKPRGQDKIEKKMISLLIKKIAKQNFQTISQSWIQKCLPEEYKYERIVETVPKAIHISDAELIANKDDLKKRLRQLENLGPAKEIKIKNDPKVVEESVWNCSTAEELAKLAIDLNNKHDHEHEKGYCDKTAKIIRMARDKRFATTYSRYQSIVIQAEHTRSLADLAGNEVVVLSRWEVDENEKKCRECIDLNHCRAEKCTHICHEFKKPMTTKGIKWAFRENEELGEFKKKIDRLYSENSDDMCEFMKIVFSSDTKLSSGEKKSLMAKHIDKDDCDACIYFTGEHPNFFKEHLE